MTNGKWYWDLGKQRAVRSEDRGLGSDTLGPYDTRGEAENWQATVEQRNESWDDDDDEWNDTDRDDADN